MDNLAERIRKAVAAIEQRDDKLAEELKAVRARNRNAATEVPGSEVAEFDPGDEVLLKPDVATSLGEEIIALRTGRPVLTITGNEPRLIFEEIESEIWRDRLVKARDGITQAVRAVGRIDLENSPRFDWVGTGWLVDEDIIVTNRHVASEFARRDGSRFTFRSSPLGTISASIDFLQEAENAASDVFDIQEILHVEPANGPDIAFLRVVARDGRTLAAPIRLTKDLPVETEQVAVIGYPARDSRIPDIELMDRIFGKLYNKKRLAPGQVTEFNAEELQHDCSTLGGNSGSVVLSLQSGEAVGLHFAGQFLKNYAVPSALVANRLNEIKNRSQGSVGLSSPPASRPTRTAETEQTNLAQPQKPGEISFQVPLTITVRLGSPRIINSSPSVTASAPDDSDVEEELFTEARVEDYSDRVGYQSNFLGNKHDIPLPTIKAVDDIVSFDDQGRKEHVLSYQHFSVIMSASRRMCFLSAVNLNGKLSRRVKRGPWKTDPRIPKAIQIIQECYGNPPKFSRGHMTRREDPIWGDELEADLGNKDSMHVTNVTPQIQPFNAGIWLRLEDYALEHSRQDKMSISVFTGPFFSKKDPVMYGVKIPTDFWKVIAFIHDETGELCATGYTLSQLAYLQREEFVFGQHETAQRPIAYIEQKAGLGFGALSSVDPLRKGEESISPLLTDFSQIVFI